MNAAINGPRCSTPKDTGALTFNTPGLVMQARDLNLGLLDALQNVDAAFVVREPGLRRTQTPRRPIEQAGTEQLLDLDDRLADG